MTAFNMTEREMMASPNSVQTNSNLEIGPGAMHDIEVEEFVIISHQVETIERNFRIQHVEGAACPNRRNKIQLRMFESFFRISAFENGEIATFTMKVSTNPLFATLTKGISIANCLSMSIRKHADFRGRFKCFKLIQILSFYNKQTAFNRA